MRLRQICFELYIPQSLRIRSPQTKKQYSLSIANLAQFLGREAELSDQTDHNIRGMMVMLADEGKFPSTVNDRRKCLVALWAWCAKRGMVATWPTVEKMPQPDPMPIAWTVDELARLIAACRAAPGCIAGVKASDWWLGLHGVGWDTGERTGALLALEWSWLHWKTRVIRVPASARKGRKKPATYTLMGDTIEVLARIQAQTKSRLIFPGIGHFSGFYKRYDTLLRRAGLPMDRYCKLQKLRKSHASWLVANGGDATKSLMHDSDSTTRRFYLDGSIVDQPPATMLFRIL